MQYRAVGMQHWNCETMDDSVVLHHALSSDTHILNFLSAEILDACQTRACSITELANLARERLGVSEKECPTGLIERCVADLDEAGLIWPND